MQYYGQNLDHNLPLRLVVLVAGSTGKATTSINGTTVHFEFNLPIYKLEKQFCYRKSSDEELHRKHLYKYLNILMLDEFC